MFKRTVWQGSTLAVVVEIVLFLLKYRFIMDVMGIFAEEDYQYRVTYSVGYRGFLEHQPKLALLFWMAVFFAALLAAFVLLKFNPESLRKMNIQY